MSMQRRLRRCSDQSGTAVVELTFVALFLITMVAGTWNYGMGWRSGMRATEAVRTGVRTGSAMGTQQLADWYALSGARASIQSSGSLANVNRVVIFRSDTANGSIPADCKTATTTSSKCNIIEGAAFTAMADTSFDSNGCLTTATVSNWCPASRIDVQLTAEYYGMWIQLTQPLDFKMLGSSITIQRQAVMRLEP